jgi:hypothetical protein
MPRSERARPDHLCARQQLKRRGSAAQVLLAVFLGVVGGLSAAWAARHGAGSLSPHRSPIVVNNPAPEIPYPTVGSLLDVPHLPRSLRVVRMREGSLLIVMPVQTEPLLPRRLPGVPPAETRSAR